MDALRGEILEPSDKSTSYTIGATAFYVLELPAGTKITIQASGSWGFDGATHGPEGQQGRLDKRSPGYPKAPLGMLIGGFSAVRVDILDEDTAKNVIWGHNTIPISHGYEGPLPGYKQTYLYLACNDAWGKYGDNHGALAVQIAIS